MRMAMRVAVLAGMALVCAQAQSQTMYRCGKVYQDRPCDAGQAGKAIGSTGTGAAPAASGTADAECVQRGRDSLKIVWSREGGATEERLVSEASTPAQKRLVRDVYRRPGAASTVQAAVEADCVAEKRKREEDAAMAAAAAILRARDGTPPSPAAQPAAPPAADPATAPRRTVHRQEIGADNKKEVCAGYNAQMESLRAEERSGATAKGMDRINESRRKLRDQMSRAGC
jgi:hypothetical protein